MHHSSCASRDSGRSLTRPGKAMMKRPCLGRVDTFHLPPTRLSLTLSLTRLKCYLAIPVASWPPDDLCLLLLCSSLSPPNHWNHQLLVFQISELYRNTFLSKRKWLYHYYLLSDQKPAGSWTEGILSMLWFSDLCSSWRQRERVENDWTILSGMDSMTNWRLK